MTSLKWGGARLPCGQHSDGDSKVVGVLDFDDVMVGHRVKDLAQAFVYLSTRFTEWQPTTKAVGRALRAGYESVRPLSQAKARWFEILVLWQGLQAIPGENDTTGVGISVVTTRPASPIRRMRQIAVETVNATSHG